MNTNDIFNPSPIQPLTKHQANHILGQLSLWGRGMITDAATLEMVKHFNLPLIATLRRLLDDETPFEGEDNSDNINRIVEVLSNIISVSKQSAETAEDALDTAETVTKTAKRAAEEVIRLREENARLKLQIERGGDNAETHTND